MNTDTSSPAKRKTRGRAKVHGLTSENHALHAVIVAALFVVLVSRKKASPATDSG